MDENIAVFDVTLQYKDESGTWRTVDPDDFPAEGVMAILSYPDGTVATDKELHFTDAGKGGGILKP